MDVRVIYRRDRYLRGGDHIVVPASRAIPAARFTEPHENFDHEHQDVRVENGVQFGDLPRVLRLRLHRPRRPGQRRRPVVARRRRPARRRTSGSTPSQLTNDTDAALDRGTEPDLAGYEVVWRETTEPGLDRTSSRSATSPTATIDLSKDNVYLRRPGRRHGRAPQPRQLPHALLIRWGGALTARALPHPRKDRFSRSAPKGRARTGAHRVIGWVRRRRIPCGSRRAVR